jgi:hypothetical protein
MAGPYSLDLRERVVAAAAGGAELPCGGESVFSCRGDGRALVPAIAGDRQPGGAADGRQASVCPRFAA